MPLVSEQEWLAELKDIESWTPSDKPTLIISPHPDDETLGAGGLIALQQLRGVPTSVVAVTDGEAAFADNPPGLAETRRLEQEKAVKELGLQNSTVRLRLPDSSLLKCEQDLENALRTLIQPGMLVVAPWINDWHPDHEACARAAQKICAESGAELISYVFWTWHRRTADVFNGFSLMRLELSPTVQSAKKAALECHVSQLQKRPGGAILPELLLAPAFRPFETFISHV